ncbi:MAG: DNA methyltransferase [Synechococcales bacterium]|nr:DNA methyltransferase [Synechococcales bacterium]
MENDKRAPRNRTLTLSEAERLEYRKRLMQLTQPVQPDELLNRTIHQDLFATFAYLPPHFVDLLVVDPPYNLSKTYHSSHFSKRDLASYTAWLQTCFDGLMPILKPTASVYVCSDWQSSPAVFDTLNSRFHIRNRITWEREKGRGAAKNWKNASEDIWFCTLADDYVFNLEAIKLKRKVVAPYTVDGHPKDWDRTQAGNFRLTHPSNLWTDITVPFWSMPENTDHPTQKPEKLIAKVILASSQPEDVVFDPFLGSGTTSVVAKKLGRRYVGIEWDELYCCLAEKRLHLAEADASIQGYAEGVFWDRHAFGAIARRRRQGGWEDG